MRKTIPIQLSIPSPCSENWDAMTPDAQGRFCAHCQKSVIDFTGWNDAALHEFFAKNNAPACGRLRNDQLNRTINIPPQPHSKLYRIAIAFGLTLLTTQIPQTYARLQTPLTEQYLYGTSGSQEPKNSSDSTYISGIVFGNDKKPVVDCEVRLLLDDKELAVTTTDSSGQYTLALPAHHKYKRVVISASFERKTANGQEVFTSSSMHDRFELAPFRHSMTVNMYLQNTYVSGAIGVVSTSKYSSSEIFMILYQYGLTIYNEK